MLPNAGRSLADLAARLPLSERLPDGGLSSTYIVDSVHGYDILIWHSDISSPDMVWRDVQ